MSLTKNASDGTAPRTPGSDAGSHAGSVSVISAAAERATVGGLPNATPAFARRAGDDGSFRDSLSRAAPRPVVLPTVRHAAVLQGMLATTGTGGNLTSDAHLAALAVEHGATVVSFDRDFGRFSGRPVDARGRRSLIGRSSREVAVGDHGR